jgi:hypothetical protein
MARGESPVARGVGNAVSRSLADVKDVTGEDSRIAEK